MKTRFFSGKENEPTYVNQIRLARKLLSERGIHALYNPHAATGKICGCGDCFCCAALEVYNEARKQIASKVNDAIEGQAT